MWKYKIWIFGGDFEKIEFKSNELSKNIDNFILNFKLFFGIINDNIYLMYFDQNCKFLFSLFKYKNYIIIYYINIKKDFKEKR